MLDRKWNIIIWLGSRHRTVKTLREGFFKGTTGQTTFDISFDDIDLN